MGSRIDCVLWAIFEGMVRLLGLLEANEGCGVKAVVEWIDRTASGWDARSPISIEIHLPWTQHIHFNFRCGLLLNKMREKEMWCTKRKRRDKLSLRYMLACIT